MSSVSYTYGEGSAYATRALSEVELEMRRDELMLVLGATGSGKSTLLRVAAGLLAPTCGRVILDGREASGSLAAAEPSVGLVFQSPETQLFAETVEADVSFGPRNIGHSDGDAVKAAREALTAVGIDPHTFGSRSPFSLSGGEARRVAIAGVLAMSPGYLLLDEPTVGLDVSGREAVSSIVSSARERSGVVVVTHDAEEFLLAADRVVLLGEGRVVFDGAADTLIQEPERFAEAGLRMPEVLRTQVLARERGVRAARFSCDPSEAARLLADARGRSQ